MSLVGLLGDLFGCLIKFVGVSALMGCFNSVG